MSPTSAARASGIQEVTILSASALEDLGKLAPGVLVRGIELEDALELETGVRDVPERAVVPREPEIGGSVMRRYGGGLAIEPLGHRVLPAVAVLVGEQAQELEGALPGEAPLLENPNALQGYKVYRRAVGSTAAFTQIGTTATPHFIDPTGLSGNFEYEIVAY